MTDELDEDNPLWLINEQIKGLLEGLGASEDHEDVLNWLRSTGLPEDTVSMIHRSIVHGSKKSDKVVCVFEGELLRIGDHLYYKDDGIKAEVVGLIDYRLSVKSKEYGVCGELFSTLTRIKP